MAFASAFSTASLQFRPISSSGEKPNSQRGSGRNGKPRNLKSRKQRPSLQYVSAVEGGEAATYTRLPPKEDFDLLNFDSDSGFEVIKLQDLVKPPSVQSKRDAQKVAEIDLGKKGNGKEINWEGYFDGEIEEDDEAFAYRVGKNERFEFYEVGSDDEYGDGAFIDGENDVEELKSEHIDVEDDTQEKEKGLPAVMRCFDRTKIYVKAGDGGNGVVAFRREKFVPLGGPSGGDGGRGGNIYMEVDAAMNSLLSFRKSVHFRAGRGGHGQGQQKNGAKGESVVVKVPPGTVVRESGGEVLLELLHPRQKALLLPGGRGGRGNAAFKTGMNKAPKIAENGEEGPEMWLDLELKLVADVGIIGAPNAGKSTFLSVISAAQPAIADYPFTTLLPNLGVVSFDYDSSIVVADLPGLLEGAHRGFGLGHEFLRHTERCSVLVHIVDGSSQQPAYEFDAVRLELELFDPELAKKPYVVAFNKMDLPEASENWESFKQILQSCGIKAFSMSAATRNGTQEVINFAYNLLRSSVTDDREGIDEPENLNHVAEIMQKQRATPINEFQISHDSSTNTFHVLGAGLERFVQMTNWRYEESERRFQHVLEACGVERSLKKLGVKEGNTVIIAGMELVWSDTNNGGTRSRSKWASEPIE